MIRIKHLILAIICSLIIIPTVLADSGTVSITGSNQVVVGNKVTVTVTISSSTKIGSWQMSLNYDKNYLQLTSSTAENGTTMANYAEAATGISKKSYTFTFKALKTGTANLSIGGALAWSIDEKPLTLSLGKKSIKIITQAELEASYSKDNNLKNLSVDGFELTPSFNKDVMDYSVTVPENTKSINIKAQVSDSKASVTGVGEKNVSAGMNNFEIIVRAENGSEKKYTVNVEVKDNNPIIVNVDNTEYTVVKIREYLPEMKAYEADTIKIDEFDIPVYKSNITNITLVGLKDKSGIIEYYIYNDGKYTKYVEITTNQLMIFPKDTDKTIDSYEKMDADILGVKTLGWVKNIKSNYIVIYGIDIASGKEGIWTYDKKNNTIISYDDSFDKEIEDYKEKNNMYSYIIIGFSGIFVILIVLLIIMVSKNKTLKKKLIKQIEDNKKEENSLDKKKVKKRDKSIDN